MDKVSTIEVVEVVVVAIAGASIGSCLKSCIELASREWRNVRLTHNSKEYIIRPNDLVASIEVIDKK